MLSALMIPEFFVRLIASLFGTLGFALLFRVHAKHLLIATVGGGFTYIIYYIIEAAGVSVFVAALASSVFLSLYSEISARIKRAPAVVFLLPCTIPIVPGGVLYRTMASFISRDFSAALGYLQETLKIGLGIAGGMVAVSLMFNWGAGISKFLKRKRKEKQEREQERQGRKIKS